MRAPPYQPPLLCCPLGKSSTTASEILQNPRCLILTGEKQQWLQGKCSRWAGSLCCPLWVRTGSDKSSFSAAGLSPSSRPLVALGWNGSLSAQASDVALGFSSRRLMSPDPKVGGSLLWVLSTGGHVAATVILSLPQLVLYS